MSKIITDTSELRVGDVITTEHRYYPENRNEKSYIYKIVARVVSVDKHSYVFIDRDKTPNTFDGRCVSKKKTGCMITLRERLERGSAVIERGVPQQEDYEPYKLNEILHDLDLVDYDFDNPIETQMIATKRRVKPTIIGHHRPFMSRRLMTGRRGSRA